jgi:hypothetical protein
VTWELIHRWHMTQAPSTAILLRSNRHCLSHFLYVCKSSSSASRLKPWFEDWYSSLILRTSAGLPGRQHEHAAPSAPIILKVLRVGMSFSKTLLLSSEVSLASGFCCISLFGVSVATDFLSDIFLRREVFLQDTGRRALV